MSIRGITIRDAAHTFLGTTDADIHYIPASSDWTTTRSGAVVLEGTQRFMFEDNQVSRCDGNGLFLNNYNRNTSIVGNEFNFVGATAISAFGSMSPCLNQNCSARLHYPSGVDGRPGNQPRRTQVIGNLIREVGLFQSQSGGWAGHLAAATHLEGNVMFNIPLSAVNFVRQAAQPLTCLLCLFVRRPNTQYGSTTN